MPYTIKHIEEETGLKVPARLSKITEGIRNKRTFYKAVEAVAFEAVSQTKEGEEAKIASSFFKNVMNQLNALKMEEMEKANNERTDRKRNRQLQIIEGWISQKQLLKITGIDRERLYQWTREGDFPKKHIRGYYYNPEATIRLVEINIIRKKNKKTNPFYEEEIKELFEAMTPPVDHVSTSLRLDNVNSII